MEIYKDISTPSAAESIDLWKLLLGRLKHRLDMRKRARTESQLSAKKSGSHEETEREEEEEEMEEREAEMEHGPVINPPRIPEERESSNVSSHSESYWPPPIYHHPTSTPTPGGWVL